MLATSRIPIEHPRKPRWNVGPGDQLLVARRESNCGKLILEELRWGITLPLDTRGTRRSGIYNIASDNIAALNQFRQQRCLVPVDAYYAWQSVTGATTKQPFAVALKDRSAFFLAGVFQIERSFDEIDLIGVALISTGAIGSLANIHPQMPVTIAPECIRGWLNADREASSLLQSYSSEFFDIWTVSKRVNIHANDDPSLLSKSSPKRFGQNKNRRKTIDFSPDPAMDGLSI